MKRPDRQNYPNGVFGDIAYDERLERYCSYLENQNKRLRIANVVGQSEQLVCNCQGCGEEKIIEYCEKCYAENLPNLAN